MLVETVRYEEGSVKSDVRTDDPKRKIFMIGVGASLKFWCSNFYLSSRSQFCNEMIKLEKLV